MEKETRNAIQTATQQARRLLEADFAEQLEGVFDIMVDGRVAVAGGTHLTRRQNLRRERIIAAIEHKRAAGMKPHEAVADYLRDAAFTALNRFVALKMLEARDLVQECITRGDTSSGFTEFCGLAPGVRFPDGSGYRLYLECIFDELSTEVKVLFDRRDPASVLWPSRATLDSLLAILNAQDLAGVWAEDETIGWVYQYFNSRADIDRARYDEKGKPKSPQNTRELAVRNQFFTPRYVVQFLTDNTLGRIWYEMRGGETELAQRCEYLVRRPDETWESRAKKDPRDLKILDPACGSAHFLLYCFDLLVVIYEEAWADPDSPKCEITGLTLQEDYPEIADLRVAVPALILRHNLHGVDIDPRCAQIAQLALWMRAQRGFRDFGMARAERPPIRRSNIVIAEPMPGEKELLAEFLHDLREDRLEGLLRRAFHIPPGRTVKATRAMADSLAELVTTVWEGMRLAGEMGPLLKIERDLARAIEKGREEWEDRLPLFRVAEYGLGGVTKESYLRVIPGQQDDFWNKAGTLVYYALAEYATAAGGADIARRKLFGEDAVQGFAFTDLISKQFDVALMNPPFGEATNNIQALIARDIPEGANDIYAAFVSRTTGLLSSDGMLGAITSRAFFVGRDLRLFRDALLNQDGVRLGLIADLGGGVLDTAMVETAAYVLRSGGDHLSIFDLRAAKTKDSSLLTLIHSLSWKSVCLEQFRNAPLRQILYDLSSDEVESITASGSIEPTIGRVTKGLSTGDDERFVRLRWEASRNAPSGWEPFSKGGEYSWFSGDVHLLINRRGEGAEMAACAERGDGNVARTRQSSAFYGQPAVTWSRRSQKGFSVRRLRKGAVFSDKSPVIIPSQDAAAWIPTLLGLLASEEYLRLINAQSKFGSFETGTAKILPAPPAPSPEIGNAVTQICEALDALDQYDERSQLFVRPLHRQDVVVARGFNALIEELSDTLRASGYTLSQAAKSSMTDAGVSD